LEGAEILFGNLETPLVPEGSPPQIPEILPGFAGSPASARWLGEAGFSLLCLANNHVMDFGLKGLRSTLRALERHGIRTVGAGEDLVEARRPALLDAGGKKVGFLAYANPGRHTAGSSSPGAAPLEEAMIKEDIRRLESIADVVVVSLHFGLIYSDYPTPEDQGIARRLCDEGATLILGHHPHVLQGVERYGPKLIAYSLGEILFDPASGHVVNRSAREIRRDSLVLRVGLGEGDAVSWEMRPLRSDRRTLHPVPLEREEGEALVARIEALSEPLRGERLRSLDVARLATRRTVGHQWTILLYLLRTGNLRLLAGWLRRLRPRHLRTAFRALMARRQTR
jgi:poly-gamma-glutamate synthesis protein (capsule biosynthesis protein)